MNMQTHRPLPWFCLAFAVFAADQAAKSTIAATTLGWTHPVTSFFNLVHVLNPGAAFSFLAGAGGWQRWFFLAIAIVVAVWLIWMLRQTRPRSESLAFSLILGGALGNAFDRALRGHVIDYLDFHLAGWHWPAFNVADMAITLGAACLVIASFIVTRQTPA
jgi:signal peptidase II